MKRGLYVGRFQPFHNGHKAVIEQIAKEVDELIIAIGSAQMSHEIKHPFTAGERILMITRSLSHLKIPLYIIPIEDINRNAVWVSHLKSHVPPFNEVYSSNPQVVRLFQEDGYNVKSIPMVQRESLSGTCVREQILKDGDWKSLVPSEVVEILEEIDGINRLKSIAQTDK